MGLVEKNTEVFDVTEINNSEVMDSEVRDSAGIVFVSGMKEDAVSVSNDVLALNIATSLNELNFDSLTKNGLTDDNLDIVVDKVVSAISCVASLQFKGSSFVEPQEIDQVKKILQGESCNIYTKKQIEQELTNFQNKINSEYKDKIKEYSAAKIELEDKLDVLESRKSKLVAERLAQFAWPFDEQTRAYDRKIYEFKARIRSFELKIQSVEAMRPAAREKDILVFQHQLKEKFSI